MSGRLDSKEVERIADLARISLTEREQRAALDDLSRIVEYVGQLGELDTEDVEPLHHVLDLRTVLRDDQPRKSLPRETALANAPARKGEYFLVPKVIGEEN